MFSKLISLFTKEKRSLLDFSHHQKLKDPVLNRQLTTQGYVVLPLLEENEILRLKELYNQWHKVSHPH